DRHDNPIEVVIPCRMSCEPTHRGICQCRDRLGRESRRLDSARMVPPVGYRAMAIVHIAMFDAVNSIEPHYRPYHAQLPATRETSKEAAAAAAAGAVLTKLLRRAIPS